MVKPILDKFSLNKQYNLQFLMLEVSQLSETLSNRTLDEKSYKIRLKQ